MYEYEGFFDLAKAGFVNEYHEIDHKAKKIRPAFTLEEILEQGFLPRGSLVRYLNRNGYQLDREEAQIAGIVEGQILTVDSCSVGHSSSTYTFKEVQGSFNTVMFEKVSEE